MRIYHASGKTRILRRMAGRASRRAVILRRRDCVEREQEDRGVQRRLARNLSIASSRKNPLLLVGYLPCAPLSFRDESAGPASMLHSSGYGFRLAGHKVEGYAARQ